MLKYLVGYVKKDKNLNKDLLKNYNLLKDVNTDDVDYFSFKGKTFYAKPCNVYDGDTFSIVFEYRKELIKYRCRCYGYDTPEMRPSLKNPNRDREKELAQKAKERMIELLNKHEKKIIKVECLDFDKYGRLLIKAYNNVDELSINEIMVNEGHGRAYDGGRKDTIW